MNNWIICYRKEDAIGKDGPTTVQINRDNIITISLYPNCVEFEFVNHNSKRFYFSEWEIKL